MNGSDRMKSQGAIELAGYDCERLHLMFETIIDHLHELPKHDARKYDQVIEYYMDSATKMISICGVLVDDLKRYIDEAKEFIIGCKSECMGDET